MNQGWKDSGDGIRYHDGRIAEAPLALCEVQGWLAYACVPRLGIDCGSPGRADEEAEFSLLAQQLKDRFNRDFWVQEHGWFAVALRPEQGAGRLAGFEHGPLPVERHRRKR